ncbi:LacI family DNA-binding transcriptional regulator [Devosia soli]|uniref:LacI family DNA-binding transcriptional regulator n=1 Tax=Devosia soli TaxID=361041 RepID=UPI00128C8022|nr:LacI family DNA-binding transcriptional regulator [Devosia soli]
MVARRLSRRPTIIDVAQRAGVCTSTATRALASSSNITDETPKRVGKAAADVDDERTHSDTCMR